MTETRPADGYSPFDPLKQGWAAAEQPMPIEHWAYHIETPFRPVHELLEMVPAALASQLTTQEEIPWSSSADQLAFREAVLRAHLDRSRSRKGPPGRDLSNSELEQVAGTRVQMRRDAAEAAGRLIAAANEALPAAKQSGDPEALKTRGATAVSGYRGSERQARLWRRYFPDYYRRTAQHRELLPSGPHGPEAVSYMIKGFGIPKWIAAPGYSNHQSGTAIDLQQERVHGNPIRNSSRPAARTAWRGTWLYSWLVQNAASFGFRPYEREPWHWEYRPAAPAHKTITAEDYEPGQEPEALGLDEELYQEEDEFSAFLDGSETDGAGLGDLGRLGEMEPLFEETEGLFNRIGEVYQTAGAEVRGKTFWYERRGERDNAMTETQPADEYSPVTDLDQDQPAEKPLSPVEHAEFPVETPFRPVHELLEMVPATLASQVTTQEEVPGNRSADQAATADETDLLPEGMAGNLAGPDGRSGMADASTSGELLAEVTDAVDRLMTASASLHDEGTFSTVGRFLGDVAAGIAVRHAISRGERRENTLADLGFVAKHPGRRPGPIRKDDPDLAKVKADWSDVRNRIVRPLLDAAKQLDRLVPRAKPPGRLCCLLWVSPVYDLGSLGVHGDAPEVLGYVFTRKLGFIDLGHARETADVTLWALTQLQSINGAARSVIDLYHGTARLLRDIPIERRLALALQLAYVDSMAHEIDTWGLTGVPGGDNSSFSPEDLPSNLFGTMVAAAAFRSDGGTNAALTTQMSRLLRAAEVQPARVGRAAQATAERRQWWNAVGDKGWYPLLKRNFSAIPWLIDDRGGVRIGHSRLLIEPPLVSADFEYESFKHVKNGEFQLKINTYRLSPRLSSSALKP